MHFLSSLKERFIKTLSLNENQVITPIGSEIFVAKGAAIASFDSNSTSLKNIINELNLKVKDDRSNTNRPPLFRTLKELKDFRQRHNQISIEYEDLAKYSGPMYLGIDSGSTTSKLVLISDDNKILYSSYANNEGEPLNILKKELEHIYKTKTKDSYIKASGVTGYGEDFIKAALNIDVGEVETIAHFIAAKYFDKEVDFIIDIGVQDMKSMSIHDGVIDSILLNEACSSGCGSFLETFSKSIGMSTIKFSEIALMAKNPVDLGSRCTVFMNSNVKQAQKEGYEACDIAAGLAYSVIQNAIQKVIKIRDPKQLGNHIVVQGGTFLSDAVLRAFENLTGRQVTRPSISGLMGAFGMALISKNRVTNESGIISEDDLKTFSYEEKETNCKGCSNQCRIKINIFPNKAKYITGNRCEKGGVNLKPAVKSLPNLFADKYSLLFDRPCLPKDKAFRGSVGIPRVLNMYENYPFWHSFLQLWDIMLFCLMKRLGKPMRMALILSHRKQLVTLQNLSTVT